MKTEESRKQMENEISNLKIDNPIHSTILANHAWHKHCVRIGVRK